jgi:hypothetical protein
MTLRELGIAAGAPLVLVCVALVHGHRVYNDHQTPWKGGGFGMFSTLDSARNRTLRCYLVTSDEEGSEQTSVGIPRRIPAIERQVQRIGAAPSKARLEALARDLVDLDFRVYLDEGEAATRSGPQPEVMATIAVRGEYPEKGDGEPARFETLRLELWQLKFDAHAVTLRAENVLSHAVQRAESSNWRAIASRTRVEHGTP